MILLLTVKVNSHSQHIVIPKPQTSTWAPAKCPSIQWLSSSVSHSSFSLTPTRPSLPSWARLSGLWRHADSGRAAFLLLAATRQQQDVVPLSYTNADSRTYKPTWIDETEERVVGREAAVPLKPPIGATTRPLDGQNLWLQRALSGVKTGGWSFTIF